MRRLMANKQALSWWILAPWSEGRPAFGDSRLQKHDTPSLDMAIARLGLLHASRRAGKERT